MNTIVNSKQFVASRLGIPFENLSQSYIQKGVALGIQSVINFPVQANNVASPLVTDNLLNLNDEFVVTSYTVFLRTAASATPTNLQLLNALPFTYFDRNTFTTTGQLNVGAVFNGTLSFTIDRKDFIPAYPCRAFYRVGDTQTAANAFFTGSAQTLVNSFPLSSYGFVESEPVKITGRQTIDISVDLGSSVDFTTSSVTNFAVLELRGFLVVNAKS